MFEILMLLAKAQFLSGDLLLIVSFFADLKASHAGMVIQALIHCGQVIAACKAFCWITGKKSSNS